MGAGAWRLMWLKCAKAQIGEAEAIRPVLMGPESLTLNRQALVMEQEKDPSLGCSPKLATCVREARDMHTG